MKEEGEGQSILSLTLRSTSTRTLGQQYKLLNPVRVGKMKIQQLVAIMTLHGESKGVSPKNTVSNNPQGSKAGRYREVRRD